MSWKSRRVSKLLHFFNLHYAPPVGVPDVTEPVMKGSIHKAIHQQYWCQWCGLRGEVTKIRLREMR